MEIKLKTLTPIWTGGVDQRCDRIHETGLIGSLRWWYEAVVRGLGNYACDPTQPSCSFDEEKYHRSQVESEHQRLLDAGVCGACQLFGCTGWARSFQAEVYGGNPIFSGRVLIPSGRKRHTRKGETAGGWFLFGESRMGDILLNVFPLRGTDGMEMIKTILLLVSRQAAIGAKVSNGYGVIHIDGLKPSLDWLNALSSQHLNRSNSLPDLRDFFFAKFEFSASVNKTDWWRKILGIKQAWNGQLDDGTNPSPLRVAKQELEKGFQLGFLPIAPAIRNWLRYLWQHDLPPKATHDLFGEAQAVCPNCYSKGFREDKKDKKSYWCSNCKKKFRKEAEIPATASKINISYAYHIGEKWQFRIWGWLPCNSAISNRDQFLQNLRFGLSAESTIWSTVFPNMGIRPIETEWLVCDRSEEDSMKWLKQLLGGGAQ